MGFFFTPSSLLLWYFSSPPKFPSDCDCDSAWFVNENQAESKRRIRSMAAQLVAVWMPPQVTNRCSCRSCTFLFGQARTFGVTEWRGRFRPGSGFENVSFRTYIKTEYNVANTMCRNLLQFAWLSAFYDDLVASSVMCDLHMQPASKGKGQGNRMCGSQDRRIAGSQGAV